VTAVLREAVGAEYLHLLDQLPREYSDLMHTETCSTDWQAGIGQFDSLTTTPASANSFDI
jgi:hypothetical protein